MMAAGLRGHVDPNTGEILDDWERIGYICKKKQHKRCYKIGNWKAVQVDEKSLIKFEIVAMNAQEKADGTGKAPISWFAKSVVVGVRESWGSHLDNYGWEHCFLRDRLNGLYYDFLPSDVKNVIIPVLNRNNVGGNTVDKLWLPMASECKPGGIFNEKLGLPSQRIRYMNASVEQWWLRSKNHNGISDTFVDFIGEDGSIATGIDSSQRCICFGFAT